MKRPIYHISISLTSPRFVCRGPDSQTVTKLADSQLVADIVTKHCIFYYHTDVYTTSRALKQNARTRLAVIEYRKRRAVPLQTITTRHSNRKQTTDEMAIA